MASFFGPGNSLDDYGDVVVIYAMLSILMRYGNSRVEYSFQKSRLVLGIGWAVCVFFGNYGFYRMGIMSFLPWFNNFIHSFIWIGVFLSFLYAGCYRRPVWEQCLLFGIFSFIVKYAERQILGTWEQDHFLFINDAVARKYLGITGNVAYIIAWSILDGLYPFISKYSLKALSKFIPGVVIPEKP